MVFLMRTVLYPLMFLASVLSGCAWTGEDAASASKETGFNTILVPDSPNALRDGVVSAGGLRPFYLQVGDVMDLKFFLNPELDQNVIVRPDGQISIPLIGDQPAAGFTPAELKSAVLERYRGTLKNPMLEVIVRSFLPAHMYVGGEVQAPAEHEYKGHITAAQAIIKSGGFTPDARWDNVIVVRYNGPRAPLLYYSLNLRSHLKNDGALLEPGEVPMGCVPSEPAGVGPAYDQSCAGKFVARAGDMLLQPFDLVFVPQTPIASVAQFFERYFNHILPAWRNLSFVWFQNLGQAF